MEKDELEDFKQILDQYDLNEDDLEIAEKTTYPKEGVGRLSGTITIKYKPTNIEKEYKKFNGHWTIDFGNDLKNNVFKTHS